jgi:hypothetical protein
MKLNDPRCLGFSRSIVFALGCLALAPMGLVGCKSDGGGNNNGGGGDGGGGANGGSNGEGGSGGDDQGGGGTGGSMNMNPDGGMPDAGLEPQPEPVIEAYAAPTATLPVTVDFTAAADLSGKFKVLGEATQSSESGGVVKIPNGKTAVLIYDTKPDEERTDTFENFTATIKFHAERLTEIWFSFATDKNRNDGFTVRFGVDHGQDGPPGVADVDSLYRASKCWIKIQGNGVDCRGANVESYGWTAFAPSMKPQTVKLTVRTDKTAKTIKTHAAYIDADGELIDSSVYEWANNEIAADMPGSMRVNRVNGELSFGLYAQASDAFIDEITIKAAEEIKDNGVVMLDDSPAQIWIPPTIGANGKIKGLIHTTPNLARPPNGVGDFALFEHLRRFATAHGWALIAGMRANRLEFGMHFEADLAKLADKTAHQEIKTVPVFLESLLNTLPYQALSDENFSKRLIGFHANKPRLGGAVNDGLGESLETDYTIEKSAGNIPGIVMYAGNSLIVPKGKALEAFWWKYRFHVPPAEAMNTMYVAKPEDSALWALTGHNWQTHAVVDSWMMYLAFLQELIKQRTTNNDGTTPLKPIDRSKGYLVTSTMAKIVTDETMAKYVADVKPFTAFPATPAVPMQLSEPQSDWVLGPATALVWQAFEYQLKVARKVDNRNVVVDVAKLVHWATVPKHGKAGESRLLKLTLAPELAGWKKIEFFDAARDEPWLPLATVMAGGATEYKFEDLSVGAHNFIARVTGPNDKIHMTHPVMAIFTP